jgi:hypothetical protein
MLETPEKFISSERTRVLGRYNTSKHHPGFRGKHHYADWYVQKLNEQNLSCAYCKTSILFIRLLITKGLLKTRRAKGEGVRGPVLEVDRRINDQGYNTQNCVLACYYCNNDKSYTTDDEDYEKFFGKARNRYFNHLFSLLNPPKP